MRCCNLAELTDKELLEKYNASNIYEEEVCEEICARVGMREDWEDAEAEDFDCIMEEAVRLLEERY